MTLAQVSMTSSHIVETGKSFVFVHNSSGITLSGLHPSTSTISRVKLSVAVYLWAFERFRPAAHPHLLKVYLAGTDEGCFPLERACGLSVCALLPVERFLLVDLLSQGLPTVHTARCVLSKWADDH